MTDKPPPKFQVGDEVKSFRGERAVVTKVITEAAMHRSHKVEVCWESDLYDDGKPGRNPDKTTYYEGVFDLR